MNVTETVVVTPAVVTPLRDRDPRQVGPWTLTGLIGAGGMGTVFLGHDQDHRQAAIKIMSDALTYQPEFRARFAREIDILHRVEGPFVATMLNADAWAEQPWVATEYVAGPDLARLVRERGPLDEKSWDGLASGLMSALVRLHGLGVVHRDMKPANVLLAADGPRVIDFGVAHLPDATALTSTGMTIGSMGWMSPEQIRGNDATFESDVFAVGGVLAFAASGRPPFGEGAPATTMHAVLHDSPDLGGLSPDQRVLIEGLLDKDPATRWSATEATQYLTGTVEPDLVDAHATQIWSAGNLTHVLRDANTTWCPTETSDPSVPKQGKHRMGWKAWTATGATATMLLGAGLLGTTELLNPSQVDDTIQAAGQNAESGTQGNAATDPDPKQDTSSASDLNSTSEQLDPITLNDLMTAPVPAMCQHPAVNLIGGEAGDGEYYGAGQLRPQSGSNRLQTDPAAYPVFGEILPGGGGGDAVATIQCDAGGTPWPDNIVLYRPGDNGPEIVGHVNLGDLTEVRSSVTGLRLEGNIVKATWTGSHPEGGSWDDLVDGSADLRLTEEGLQVENVTISPVYKQ